MKTPKLLVAVLAASAFFGALVLAQAGCTSDDLSTPTGCVGAYPDAGNDYQCAVQWSCNNSETFQIECTLTPGNSGNSTCTCSTNTSSAQSTVTLYHPSCDLGGGVLQVANACGFMLQM